MNDKQAKRVTNSWSKLLKILPISKIISSFAASYRDKVLTWRPWAGGATVSDIVQWGAAGFKVNSMPVIGISAAATWGSFSSTKPSQMRLNLYYGNQKKYASPFQIFKKH